MEGVVQVGIRRTAIHGKEPRNFALFILVEPPYTEPYVRWCERSGANHSLLLDLGASHVKKLD
jgi:hypothetical protein